MEMKLLFPASVQLDSPLDVVCGGTSCFLLVPSFSYQQ